MYWGKLEVGRHGKIIDAYCTKEECLKVLKFLKRQTDFVYKEDIIEEMHDIPNLRLSTGKKLKGRALRSVCQVTNWIVSGTKGYRLISLATTADRDDFEKKLHKDIKAKKERLQRFLGEERRLINKGKIPERYKNDPNI